jgi:hypothetical protein
MRGLLDMRSIDAVQPPPFDMAASVRWALFVLRWLGLPLVLVAAWAQPPISCERHQGAFSNGFSPNFDIASIDCRASWLKNAPTIRFLGVPPFVGIE